MHSLDLRGTTALCSTNERGSSTRPAARSAGLRVRAAKDIMCKDVVNVRKQAVLQGQATVVFAGVEGQEVAVACPKVRRPSLQIRRCSQACVNIALRLLQDTYILDAGIDAGLELPFTCRAGICGYAAAVLAVSQFQLPSCHANARRVA